MDSETKETIVAFLIVGVAVGLVIWLIMAKLADRNTTVDSNTVYDIPIMTSPVLGDEKAPVTMILFDDFECPICKQFARDVVPKIRENYIDTGKVKLVFKNFPLQAIHPKAFRIATAAMCAHEQDAFWEYHDLVFEYDGSPEIGTLQEFARTLELDTEQFDTCFISDKYDDEVNDDYILGVNAQVTGTPTFFINGKKTTGYKDASTVALMIENALASVEGEE